MDHYAVWLWTTMQCGYGPLCSVAMDHYAVWLYGPLCSVAMDHYAVWLWTTMQCGHGPLCSVAMDHYICSVAMDHYAVWVWTTMQCGYGPLCSVAMDHYAVLTLYDTDFPSPAFPNHTLGAITGEIYRKHEPRALKREPDGLCSWSGSRFPDGCCRHVPSSYHGHKVFLIINSLWRQAAVVQLHWLQLLQLELKTILPLGACFPGLCVARRLQMLATCSQVSIEDQTGHFFFQFSPKPIIW